MTAPASLLDVPPLPANAPWELRAVAASDGARSMGRTAEASIATAPTKYQQRSRDVLTHAAAALNSPVDGMRAAYQKAHVGSGYLLPDVRRDAASEIFTASLNAVDGHVADAVREVADLTRAVRDDLVPVRPASVSDHDETARKADLRMRLDTIGLDDLGRRSVDVLTEAVAVSDDATIWLLAGCSWGRWYLESRGMDPVQLQRFAESVAQVAPPAPERADLERYRDGGLVELERFVGAVAQVAGMVREQWTATFAGLVTASIR